MIRIEGLEHDLLDIPSLHIAEGNVAVIGRNGSGKTTLLELLAGMDTPKKGSVRIFGSAPAELGVGWVGEFPDHTILFSRVFDEVASSLRFKRVPAEEADHIVLNTLTHLRIERLIDRTTAELSGGEKALVAFAAAIAGSPRIMILDEVDSHLDNDISSILWSAVIDSGIPSVFCTQDMDQAAQADTLLVLEDGKVIHCGSPAELFPLMKESCFYPPLWRLDG
ncbi:MAG: energy-coupling factor transport system ATP-binding protein [Candidatus Methanomethylophilaceae archaeon]|nr:energy-coupling factor transport system ATP-binding protein [Candidatus Methanomethylophilaceae archaeon]MDI3542369.1 energy-coupling factor transport system ATP-binding protein [Candidatus Methanomethylophilaceae archaeon]